MVLDLGKSGSIVLTNHPSVGQSDRRARHTLCQKSRRGMKLPWPFCFNLSPALLT